MSQENKTQSITLPLVSIPLRDFSEKLSGVVVRLSKDAIGYALSILKKGLKGNDDYYKVLKAILSEEPVNNLGLNLDNLENAETLKEYFTFSRIYQSCSREEYNQLSIIDIRNAFRQILVGEIRAKDPEYAAPPAKPIEIPLHLKALLSKPEINPSIGSLKTAVDKCGRLLMMYRADRFGFRDDKNYKQLPLAQKKLYLSVVLSILKNKDQDPISYKLIEDRFNTLIGNRKGGTDILISVNKFKKILREQGQDKDKVYTPEEQDALFEKYVANWNNLPNEEQHALSGGLAKACGLLLKKDEKGHSPKPLINAVGGGIAYDNNKSADKDKDLKLPLDKKPEDQNKKKLEIVQLQPQHAINLHEGESKKELKVHQPHQKPASPQLSVYSPMAPVVVQNVIPVVKREDEKPKAKHSSAAKNNNLLAILNHPSIYAKELGKHKLETPLDEKDSKAIPKLSSNDLWKDTSVVKDKIHLHFNDEISAQHFYDLCSQSKPFMY